MPAAYTLKSRLETHSKRDMFSETAQSARRPQIAGSRQELSQNPEFQYTDDPVCACPPFKAHARQAHPHESIGRGYASLASDPVRPQSAPLGLLNDRRVTTTLPDRRDGVCSRYGQS
jgi:hypothetical protein